MDRTIWQPGQIPVAEGFEGMSLQALKGLAFGLQSVMGQAPVADGFAATPGTGLSVSIAPGSIMQPSVVDTSSYGPLAADTSTIYQQYLSVFPATISTPSNSITHIYAVPTASDGNSIVLPYYNANNPQQPFAGPNNSGTAQPTVRMLGITFVTLYQSGCVPICTVTVPSGATSVTQSMIVMATGAPFLPWKLPNIQADVLALLAQAYLVTPYSTTTQLIVPPGYRYIGGRAVAGGGGGANCGPFTGSSSNLSGAGGASGQYGEYLIPVSAGDVLVFMPAAGGGPQQAGGNTLITQNGKTVLSLIGGPGATISNQTSSGAIGGGTNAGPALGCYFTQAGSDGADGQTGSNLYLGDGGPGPWGGLGRSGNHAGISASGNGAGGGGARDASSGGGNYYGGYGGGGVINNSLLP